jgi:hypothetical protein
MPLYVLGRKLEDLFPVAFLPENHGLAIAIMSYNGGIDYGLLGDYDALPDIDVIAAGIDDALQELLGIARGGQTPSRPRSARPRSRSATRAKPAPVAAAAPGAAAVPAPAVATAEPMLPLPNARATGGPAADMRAKRNRPTRSQAKPS